MEKNVQIVLVASAIFIPVTLVLVVIFLVLNRRRFPDLELRARTRTRTRTVCKSELSSIAIAMDESASFDDSLSQISMPELVRATRNFSPDLIIGDGGFGQVYKARLDSRVSVTVAVKKLSSDAFHFLGHRQFLAELETLGKIRHENIVTILGYCAAGSERVLIYEFVEKGCLEWWLFDDEWSWTSENEASSSLASKSLPRLPLPWETRLKIIKGVANGLSYMHNLETPIIHRDIKASNVLLDNKFEALIADFGIARAIEGSRSHVSTQPAGSDGYMPPEYFHGATRATLIGDVYSFGILMLVIGTGIRPDLPFKDENKKEVMLVEWARKMLALNRQMKMLDVTIPRVGLKKEGVVEFFRIAAMCTDDTGKNRPKMKAVLDFINQIPT